jgi:hypothetical protein
MTAGAAEPIAAIAESTRMESFIITLLRREGV